MVNQKYLDKAEVLIEALPYIQRFNRKVIVVKYGGSAMVDEQLKRDVIKDVVLLKLVGFKPIIVHGGGKEISRWVGKVGKEAKFVNGLRVTDDETMEIAEMVLGKVNKELVTLVQSLGVRAVGISGKDGGLLSVNKKLSDGQDIGYVGDVKTVNPKILYDLLEKDFLPIVCPIGLGDDFATYNINADDAACAIACSMKAEKLAFLTDMDVRYTYGYRTNMTRKEWCIVKTHHGDAFCIAGNYSLKRAETLYYTQHRRNNRSLEKFYDAKYLDSRDGKRKSGKELFNGRTARNKNFCSENLHQYRSQKLSKGRRSIRKHHYMYQPNNMVWYERRKYRVKGTHCNGTKVILDSGKSVSVKNISIAAYNQGVS